MAPGQCHALAQMDGVSGKIGPRVNSLGMLTDGIVRQGRIVATCKTISSLGPTSHELHPLIEGAELQMITGKPCISSAIYRPHPDFTSVSKLLVAGPCTVTLWCSTRRARKMIVLIIPVIP